MSSVERLVLTTQNGPTPLPERRGEYERWLAVIAWSGLGLRIYSDLRATSGDLCSILTCIINYFSYFSTEINLLVALSATLITFQSRIMPTPSRPSAQSALVGYIIVVGVTFELLLRTREPWTPFIADTIMHVITPILYVLYWFFFLPKGMLLPMDPIVWLIYPIIYLAYIVVRGAVFGVYPYPFVDVTKIGYRMTLLNALIFLLIFLILGCIVTIFDRRMGSVKS